MDTRIQDAADSLLANLADALSDEGIVVPERRFTHTGQIVHDFASDDCASAFIVAWQGMFQGQTGSQGAGVPIKCVMPLQARFHVALLRCAPGLGEDAEPPTPEQNTAAADEVMVDAMTLGLVTVDETLRRTLIDNRINVTAIESILPVGPGGYVGGCLMSIITTLL